MPGSGPKPSESPAPGYAQLILRVLRRVWNPSLVRLEAEHSELQTSYAALQSANEELNAANEALQAANSELTAANDELKRRSDDADARNESSKARFEEASRQHEEANRRYEEFKSRYEQISARYEQNMQLDCFAAEECRQRAELLLFEMHNHLAHLAARLTGEPPTPFEGPAQASGAASVETSLRDTLEQCRMQLSQLVDASRNGFAQVNEWLDPVLRPPQQLGYDEAFEFLRTHLQWLRLDAGAFDPKKVVMIGSTLGAGGGERQLAMTARGLKKANAADIRVVMTNMQNPADAFFKPALEDADVPVLALNSNMAEFDDARAQFILAVVKRFAPPDFDFLARDILALTFMLHQQRPGIVHCWQDGVNVTGGLAAQIAGVPRIILAGQSLTPVGRTFYQPYMRPAYLGLAADSRVTILNNSRAGADDYAHWLEVDVSRMTVIRNGFEFPTQHASEAAKSSLRKSLGIPDRAPVVGSVIRFMAVKRPELLVDSLCIVLKARPDAHVVIFGDGEYLDSIREQARLASPDGRIHLPGRTTDVWTALAIMDLFVLTSEIEGLPNVLVEAQASGVPIITTNVGGTREAYEDNVTGWSVPTDVSAAELATRCIEILNDEARRSLAGDRAWKFARERFGADRMIAETLAVYRQGGRSLARRRKDA